MSSSKLAGTVVAEMPPGPETVKSAQRETRRLIDMSRGPIQMAFGVWCLLWAGVLQLPRLQHNADMATIWWALGMMFAATITQRLVLQARKRAGIPNVAARKSDEPGATRKISLALVLGFGVALGLLYAVADNRLPYPGPTVFGLAVLFLVVPLIYRGVSVGLWEHFLQAGGLLAGMIILLTGGEPLQMTGLCVTLGAAELLAGLSLHQRWKAWVATLPRDGSMSDPEAHA